VRLRVRGKEPVKQGESGVERGGGREREDAVAASNARTYSIRQVSCSGKFLHQHASFGLYQ
jgi:hypothetical protein